MTYIQKKAFSASYKFADTTASTSKTSQSNTSSGDSQSKTQPGSSTTKAVISVEKRTEVSEKKMESSMKKQIKTRKQFQIKFSVGGDCKPSVDLAEGAEQQSIYMVNNGVSTVEKYHARLSQCFSDKKLVVLDYVKVLLINEELVVQHWQETFAGKTFTIKYFVVEGGREEEKDFASFNKLWLIVKQKESNASSKTSETTSSSAIASISPLTHISEFTLSQSFVFNKGTLTFSNID